MQNPINHGNGSLNNGSLDTNSRAQPSGNTSIKKKVGKKTKKYFNKCCNAISNKVLKNRRFLHTVNTIDSRDLPQYDLQENSSTTVPLQRRGSLRDASSSYESVSELLSDARNPNTYSQNNIGQFPNPNITNQPFYTLSNSSADSFMTTTSAMPNNVPMAAPINGQVNTGFNNPAGQYPEAQIYNQSPVPLHSREQLLGPNITLQNQPFYTLSNSSVDSFMTTTSAMPHNIPMAAPSNGQVNTGFNNPAGQYAMPQNPMPHNIPMAAPSNGQVNTGFNPAVQYAMPQNPMPHNIPMAAPSNGQVNTGFNNPAGQYAIPQNPMPNNVPMVAPSNGQMNTGFNPAVQYAIPQNPMPNNVPMVAPSNGQVNTRFNPAVQYAIPQNPMPNNVPMVAPSNGQVNTRFNPAVQYAIPQNPMPNNVPMVAPSNGQVNTGFNNPAGQSPEAQIYNQSPVPLRQSERNVNVNPQNIPLHSREQLPDPNMSVYNNHNDHAPNYIEEESPRAVPPTDTTHNGTLKTVIKGCKNQLSQAVHSTKSEITELKKRGSGKIIGSINNRKAPQTCNATECIEIPAIDHNGGDTLNPKSTVIPENIAETNNTGRNRRNGVTNLTPTVNHNSGDTPNPRATVIPENIV